MSNDNKMDDEDLVFEQMLLADVAIEHGHPTFLCEYLGMDMWSCGHIDNCPEANELDNE
jgi:hypothetical protein